MNLFIPSLTQLPWMNGMKNDAFTYRYLCEIEQQKKMISKEV